MAGNLAAIIAANAAKKAGQPAVAGAIAGIPFNPDLGGGSRLAQIRAGLAQASLGSNINRMLCGTAWYLLKNGSFKESQKGQKLSTFSFLCVNPISDIRELSPSAANYSGPRKGETYDVALFQTGTHLTMIVKNNLTALAACMGWPEAYARQLKDTKDGQDAILELQKGLLCFDFENQIPLNQVCVFANQVVLEMTTKPQTPKNKEGQVVQPTEDDKKKFTNTYWNKRIPLQEVAEVLGEEGVIKAFGSLEAFASALEIEQQALSIA